MKKNIFILIFIGSILANGVFSAMLFSQKPENKTSDITAELESKYSYLSQKILQDYDRDLLINFVPLRANLNELVGKQYGSDFSFYFEYLPTGSSIGVNEKTEFYSASLLKLPTVMAYYYMKDRKNIKEDKEVVIEEDDIDNHFGSLWKRGAGEKIRLSQAARLSLVQSDNTATKVLLKNIEPQDFDAIYDGLDIKITRNNNSNQISITTKSYASILKALFFSSVLSKEDSQYVLDILTKTEFNDKLSAGVSSDISVAHKIGVYENLKVLIYSDCGIVYIPKRQYALCMASRSDEKTATERMKTVSKIIYDFVSIANGIH